MKPKNNKNKVSVGHLEADPEFVIAKQKILPRYAEPSIVEALEFVINRAYKTGYEHGWKDSD